MSSPRPTASRPIVITTIGAFWPANDASGPNQSFKAILALLGDEFDFRLVARDRAFGASESSVIASEWGDFGRAKAMYLAPGAAGCLRLAQLLREEPYDLLWLSSFFDPYYSILPLVLRRLGCIPKRPVLLSPRGEFAPGALGLKSVKKRCYRAFARMGGLLDDVNLHATDDTEVAQIQAADIRRVYSCSLGVLVAPNVRLIGPQPPQPAPGTAGGPLKLAFVGRISPVKNLDYAIDALRYVVSPVKYDLYGPVQDATYWANCKRLISTLPAHVRVELKGEVPNESMVATLAEYDLLFLPTKGENFGHAILDALEAATPVLISDQTPFRNLARQGAGFDFSLAEPQRFAEALDRFAALDHETRMRWRTAARALAEQTVASGDAIAENKKMLKNLIDSTVQSAS